MVDTLKSGSQAGNRPKTLNDSIHAQAAAALPSSGNQRVISIVGSAQRSLATGGRNRSQSPSAHSRRQQSQRSGRTHRQNKKSHINVSDEKSQHATPEADLSQGVKGLTLGSPTQDQTLYHPPRNSQQWNRSNGRNPSRGRSNRSPPATSESSQVVSEDQRHRESNRQRKIQSIGHREWDQPKEEQRGPPAKANGASHTRTRQSRTHSMSKSSSEYSSSGLRSSMHNPTSKPWRKQGRPVDKPNGVASTARGSVAQTKDSAIPPPATPAGTNATTAHAASPPALEPTPKSPPATSLPMVYDDSLDWADDLDE
ncbi:hypothetical protein H4R35_002678 [Dimargaris xerosporica]|nr:hypothetical protein H4R35_002678 [Dimargaris xerosporica]